MCRVADENVEVIRYFKSVVVGPLLVCRGGLVRIASLPPAGLFGFCVRLIDCVYILLVSILLCRKCSLC